MAKKKKTSTSKEDKSNIVRNLIFFSGIVLFAYLYMRYKISPTQSVEPITEQLVLNRTWNNYYQEVDSIAKEFELSTPYLLALIVLECSGKKEIEPRFEAHIYKELKRARDTKDRFGSMSYKKIKHCNNTDLQNLATSWGPFQLMGYQSIEMDVRLEDIKGSHSVYWGCYWIYKRYGKYLKKDELTNAFHIHNAGRPAPKNGEFETHNPNYIKNGLAYYAYFKQRIKEAE